MSYSVNVVGRDKEKLKAVIRAAQCKDEEKQPHSGVPKRVADYLCNEVDRSRIYQFDGRVFGLHVEASGSFHEQGSNETSKIYAVELAE